MAPNETNGERRKRDIEVATYMGKMTQAMEDTSKTISTIGLDMKDMRKEIKEDFEKARTEVDTKVKGAHLRIDKFYNWTKAGGIIGTVVTILYAAYSKITGVPLPPPGH